MRPENSYKKDVIDNLLGKTWETPPAHLENQLRAIPQQLALEESRNPDRLSLILNAILLFWGMGLIMYFWSHLDKMMTYFSTQILGVSALSPQILSQPVVGLIILAFLLVGWVWMDIEKHPSAS